MELSQVDFRLAGGCIDCTAKVCGDIGVRAACKERLPGYDDTRERTVNVISLDKLSVEYLGSGITNRGVSVKSVQVTRHIIRYRYL